MNLKDSMMLYGVTLGKRYTKRQKASFIKYVTEELDRNNISYKVQDKRSSVLSIRNLIIGNPEKADVVIAAAYDTPSIPLIKKYCWYPFQPSKNKRQDKLNSIIEAILICLFFMIAVIGFRNVILSEQVIYKLVSFAIAVIALVLGYNVSVGRACSVSFNMNSASVALVMDMVMNCEYSDKVCYVLYSEGVTSVEGVKALKDVIPENKKIIFLSSLAQGSKRLAVCGHNKDYPEELKVKLPSYECHVIKGTQMDQTIISLFPHALILVAGEKVEKDFVTINGRTDHDSQVDMNELQETEKGLISYLKNERNEKYEVINTRR